MSDQWAELRRLTVAHQDPLECVTCAERFQKIQEAAELVVGRRVLSVLSRRASLVRMRRG